MSIQEAKSRKTVAGQVSRHENGILVTWLADGLKAGQTQTYVLKGLTRSISAETVTVLPDLESKKLNIAIGGKLFTSYHYGREWVRPFLHPVVGPYGVKVTRNWPMSEDTPGEHRDHHHHKSIWVAFGECSGVDNWSEEQGHGWQRHRGFLDTQSGPVFGRIVAQNDWCAANEKKQFEEVRDLCIYALPGGVRLFDIAVTFKMTERAVTFTDTKEGGLISVRVATSMDVTNGGRIENGYGGINEGETWGKNAPWCDYSGVVDGKSVGIAILDHESNPRYPTGWHVRNYGLMTANCFAWSRYRPEAGVKGDMMFPKGSQTTWRYRIYIHRGDARRGRVADRFLDFVAPPKVTVE
ncbi:MAG: PmoA family protein [Candidatus Hydrogenedentes bacterium]|nr:PmoA family protein [Candidatus Hydrogenedentota bacterium]